MDSTTAASISAASISAEGLTQYASPVANITRTTPDAPYRQGRGGNARFSSPECDHATVVLPPLAMSYEPISLDTSPPPCTPRSGFSFVPVVAAPAPVVKRTRTIRNYGIGARCLTYS